ncbi:MAG: TOBE domain-containing protein [Paracoccaceae bacterium]|nr:TOBE domain-containing protein [Paracoccaceae bacterium]
MADFIGDANLIAGTVQNGTFHAGDLGLALAGPDGAATVSIRPERIGLRRDGSAKVISATYLGSRTEYVVQTGAGEMLVSRPIWEDAIDAGAAVTIEIRPTDLTRVK